MKTFFKISSAKSTLLVKNLQGSGIFNMIQSEKFQCHLYTTSYLIFSLRACKYEKLGATSTRFFFKGGGGGSGFVFCSAAYPGKFRARHTQTQSALFVGFFQLSWVVSNARLFSFYLLWKLSALSFSFLLVVVQQSGGWGKEQFQTFFKSKSLCFGFTSAFSLNTLNTTYFSDLFFNPALTIALAANRNILPKRAVCFVWAQLIGGKKYDLTLKETRWTAL